MGSIRPGSHLKNKKNWAQIIRTQKRGDDTNMPEMNQHQQQPCVSCCSLITDVRMQKLKSTGFILLSSFSAAQLWWMKVIRSAASPALRKHTSVDAALPSSPCDCVIYWSGASCHWWVISAGETVPQSGCGIHTGIWFHCSRMLTVHSSTRWSDYKC